MAANAPAASIFSVSLASATDAATVTHLADVTVPSSYVSFTPVAVGSKTYLLGYNPAQPTLDVFEFTPAAPWLQLASAKPQIGAAKDKICVFTLGNLPYLCVYTAKNGVFETYLVASDLTLSKPYEFYRNHELALSQNFTTLKFFAQFGQVVFLGYRDDGYVAMYTATTAVSSPSPDIPPLLMTPQWSHMWAPGWTRFAFFQFGGEPFFLKTNTQKLNVNIDHVLDTLSLGTTEVGTLLQAQLPAALQLTNVEPLTLGDADPWFVTYIASTGSATLNRIHADCLGWTQGAQFTSTPGASVVAPLAVGGQTFLILV